MRSLSAWRPLVIAGLAAAGLGLSVIWAVDHPEPLMPAQRLQRRLDNSADLSDLIRLAASFNGGVDYLCAQIRKRAENVQLPH